MVWLDLGLNHLAEGAHTCQAPLFRDDRQRTIRFEIISEFVVREDRSKKYPLVSEELPSAEEFPRLLTKEGWNNFRSLYIHFRDREFCIVQFMKLEKPHSSEYIPLREHD